MMRPDVTHAPRRSALSAAAAHHEYWGFHVTVTELQIAVATAPGRAEAVRRATRQSSDTNCWRGSSRLPAGPCPKRG
jgi:hypothetical protein